MMIGNLEQRLKRLQNDRFLDNLMMMVFSISILGFAVISFFAGGVDFRGYYTAAALVLRGGNPYDYRQLAPLLQEITGFVGNNPYYYPPWFCLFFIPLTLFPFQVARVLWLVLNLFLLYFSLENLRKVFLWPPLGWRRWAVYLLASVLFALICLRSEQSGILLLWGLSLVLWGIKNDRPFLTGLGLVILATKPQATGFAVLFLCIWLFIRDKRALAWAFLLTVGLTGLASLAIPRWWDFDRTGFGSGLSVALEGPGSPGAVRVNATLYDFLKFQFGLSPMSWLVVLLVIVYTLLILWLARSSASEDPAFPASLGILYTLLITPYALQYDHVPAIVPLFWILSRAGKQPPHIHWIVTAGIAAMFLLIFLQRWSYTGYLMMPILLLLMIVMTYAVRKSR